MSFPLEFVITTSSIFFKYFNCSYKTSILTTQLSQSKQNPFALKPKIRHENKTDTVKVVFTFKHPQVLFPSVRLRQSALAFSFNSDSKTN